MPIHIPPLRDRKEDLLIIAHNLLEDLNRRFSKDIFGQKEVKSILLSYDWPGNIRELKSVLMRAVHCSIMAGSILNIIKSYFRKQRSSTSRKAAGK